MANNREDYLLVIWEFSESFGFARERDIVKRLKISAATASEYLKKMEDEGIITRDGRRIRLTEKGEKLAIPVVRTHRIVEVFSHQLLETPWEDAHSSVMELEHLFSDKKGEVLYRHLGEPDVCPHGNPINPIEKRDEIRASEAKPGVYIFLRTTYEDGNFLRSLSEAGIIPGEEVEVRPDQTIKGPRGILTSDARELDALRLIKKKS